MFLLSRDYPDGTEFSGIWGSMSEKPEQIITFSDATITYPDMHREVFPSISMYPTTTLGYFLQDNHFNGITIIGRRLTFIKRPTMTQGYNGQRHYNSFFAPVRIS